MKYPYWNIRRITCGTIDEPEDFIVKEVISQKFLRKFSTGKKVQKIEGPYTLYILKKRGMTTHNAIEEIARQLGIDENLIGYAGLKDKFAVTTQYVTIKNIEKEIESGNFSLNRIGVSGRHISIGDLQGNEFEITLHGCRSVPARFARDAEKGIANYFGPQRFGVNENNHVIGKLLVRREFAAALKMISEMYGKNFTSLLDVKRKKLKFFINAYQSWLFNQALRKSMEGKVPETIEIPGYQTNTKNKILLDIMKKEKVREDQFMIKDLGLCCRGALRKAVITTNVGIEKTGDGMKFRFFLPRGSYATTLLANI